MLSDTRAASLAVKIDRLVALIWSIWKTRNNIVFCSETPYLGITLTRAKKATAQWRIRHNLTQSIQLPNPNISTTSQKKTYWVAWKKPQGDSSK